MRAELMEKSTLFADNRDKVSKKFKWDNSYMSYVAATYFTNAGKKVDETRMKECKKFLKKNEGAFSVFRNNMVLPMISKMALSETPEEYYFGVKEVYDKLHKHFTLGSEYLLLAAMMIYENKDDRTVDEMVEKTVGMLDSVKKQHPFITSKDDLALISLLATVKKSSQELLSQLEECYQTLKDIFHGHTNAVQSLAFVLTLSDKPVKEKCDMIKKVYDLFVEHDRKYHKGQEMAALGALVDLDVDLDQLVSEICEVDDYLKTRKGFGTVDFGKYGRMMYATMLTVNTYSENMASSGASIAAFSLATAIASQVSILVAISCTTAAATANS